MLTAVAAEFHALYGMYIVGSKLPPAPLRKLSAESIASSGATPLGPSFMSASPFLLVQKPLPCPPVETKHELPMLTPVLFSPAASVNAGSGVVRVQPLWLFSVIV